MEDKKLIKRLEEDIENYKKIIEDISTEYNNLLHFKSIKGKRIRVSKNERTMGRRKE